MQHQSNDDAAASTGKSATEQPQVQADAMEEDANPGGTPFSPHSSHVFMFGLGFPPFVDMRSRSR